MPTSTSRSQKHLLIFGPSVLVVFLYLLLSVVYINTTDQHLLTSEAEQKRLHLGLYDRYLTFLHRKMLFTTPQPISQKQPSRKPTDQAAHK